MAGIVFSIYLLGVLPVLLGGALRTVQREKMVSLAELYAIGWVAYLAIFAIPMIAASDRDLAPSELLRYFVIAALILGAAAFIVGFKRIIRAVVLALRNFRPDISFVLWLAVIALSVAFIMPKASDTTSGIVSTAVSYDSFYGHDVYTGESLEVVMPHHSPIEALYTLMALSSGMEADVYIMRLLSAFMLFSALCAYRRAARVFFGRGTSGKWFMAAALLFFGIEVLRDGHLQTALLMNVWNGLTYACSVVFPLAFTECIAYVRKRKLWAAFISLGVFALAAQLLTHQAGGVMVFMWIVLGVISYVA